MSNTSIDTGADAARVEDTADTILRLRKKLENYRRKRAKQAGWTPQSIHTGLAPLDAVLPHGGLPGGAITEIISDDPGAGAMSLAVRIAAQSILEWHGQAYPPGWPTSSEVGDSIPPGAMVAGAPGSDSHDPNAIHRRIVLVDTTQDFYPPAAWQHGIMFDRLIVIRTNRWQDAFWAVDQSLRCRAVAAVIAPLPQLDECRSRRLQLAAKSSGCLGLILRPTHGRAKSFAAVQMLIESAPDGNPIANEGAMPKQTGAMAAPRSRYTSGSGRDHVLTVDQHPSFSEPRAQTRGSGWPASSEVGDSIQTSRLTCPSASNIPPYPGGIEGGYRIDPYLCRITLLTIREGMPVEPLWVDLHHETGDVPLHPVPVDRSAAKTG